MSEVQFAKSFMSVLDRRAVKLGSDFVSDPKKYPAQSPYILPKPTTPFPSRKTDSTPAAPATISVTLKPMKGPSEAVTLSSQDANTTVLDLKTQYATQASLDISKVKLLYNKRPASDLKTLKELLPTPTPSSVEFSVMVLGGGSGASGISTPPVYTPAASSPAVEIPDPTSVPTKADRQAPAPLSEKAEQIAEAASSTAQHAAGVLKSEQFWLDLKDFLMQRLRDEQEGERLMGLFRSASQGLSQ
ncbi:hypothetical protein MBLNU457_g0724t2 [Dothideomycetes sp. NU457]